MCLFGRTGFCWYMHSSRPCHMCLVADVHCLCSHTQLNGVMCAGLMLGRTQNSMSSEKVGYPARMLHATMTPFLQPAPRYQLLLDNQILPADAYRMQLTTDNLGYGWITFPSSIGNVRTTQPRYLWFSHYFHGCGMWHACGMWL